MSGSGCGGSGSFDPAGCSRRGFAPCFLGFVSFAERTFEKARERSVVSKEGWKKEREEILEVVDERWKTPTTTRKAGARCVLSRSGTLRSAFDCKALEISISIDDAFGRQGNRRNLPGRGRGRCEVAAASKALPPASRPRIGLWLGSLAGASPLSCAIEVRFNSCVLDQGDNSERELRRGWRAEIFLCFFFPLFFERGGEKKKWSTWLRFYFSLS